MSTADQIQRTCLALIDRSARIAATLARPAGDPKRNVHLAEAIAIERLAEDLMDEIKQYRAALRDTAHD